MYLVLNFGSELFMDLVEVLICVGAGCIIECFKSFRVESVPNLPTLGCTLSPPH